MFDSRGILDDPHELRDLTNLMSMSLDSDVFIDENSDTWRARYYKVDAKFKVISEQKVCGEVTWGRRAVT